MVQSLGGDSKAFAVQADAGSVPGIKSMVDAVVKKFGKIDILVPNAGALMMKGVMETTEAEIIRTFSGRVQTSYPLAD